VESQDANVGARRDPKQTPSCVEVADRLTSRGA
jgi:hypothetical protein